MKPYRASLALTAIVALAAMGADDAVETHNVQGVKFDAPKSWKSGKPSSQMRLAQFKVGPEKGDEDAAELVLFAFPGGGGPVQANLDRWAQQFEGKDGNAVKIKTDTRKGKNTEVTYAEASGRYVAAVTPGGQEKFDKPGWMLLGAIVQTDDTGYFFKMVGPEKTMTAAKPAFEALIKSIAVE
jgi:hypothetical protein